MKYQKKLNRKIKIKQLLNQFYKNYYMKQAGNDSKQLDMNINKLTKEIKKLHVI